MTRHPVACHADDVSRAGRATRPKPRGGAGVCRRTDRARDPSRAAALVSAGRSAPAARITLARRTSIAAAAALGMVTA
jgi:hypothetical protein